MDRILHDARNAERILQMTADTLLLVAPDGVCVDISAHSSQWFLQEEILLGKNLFELLPEHTSQKVLPAFQEVVNEKKRINRNFRLDLSDGTYYFKCIMYPYDDKVLCQYRDITQRNNIKLQLEQANKELNTLTHAINNAKESIFAADESGTLIFANRQFLKNHHIADGVETSSLKVYNIVGDIQTPEAWRHRCKQVKPGKSANFIAYHPLRNDKNALAFEGIIYHVTSDEGTVSYWSFSHDISERLRYESQIKRLNRIMDTTMNNLPASIAVKDINNDFRYIYRNQQLYGYDNSLEKAIGKSDFDYYPPEVAEMKREEDREIARTGKEIHLTIENKDRDGNLRILDKRKLRVDSKDFSPIIINIEWDITQLELMKRELMIEKNKAETSDHLKSAFLANMSHEIRTPLNAIVGFSRIISESDDPQERKEYYEIVEANNDRLLQLINEILDLSKIESGIVEFTVTPIKLHRLCKEIHDAHVFRCPAEVKLIFEPSDDALIIDSDKNRVFQVISNLIGNAFKFTTEGSISYGYRREGDFMVFHVSDTGFGIQEDKVGQIFERFVKVNNFAQGTGLGLSICKSIIERLGGEISVVSEVGKGTTFTFTLPARKEHPELPPGEISFGPETANFAAHPQAGNPHHAAQTEADKVGRRATILIAEDTDSNYELLKAILGREYHLERALDGMEAVTLFDEVKPNLILMDIKMPNLNGLEATKIIRELSTTVPIIAQSAYAFEHDRRMAEEAGCTDFIAKPIAQGKLKEIVKKYL